MGILDRIPKIDSEAMAAKRENADALRGEARAMIRRANELYLGARGQMTAAAADKIKELTRQANELFREADAMARGLVFVPRADDSGASTGAGINKQKRLYRPGARRGAERTPEDMREYNRARVAAWRARQKIKNEPLSGLI